MSDRRTFDTSGTTLTRSGKVFTIACEDDETANRVASQLRTEQPSIYKRASREGGYTFVTCPDYPGFSMMLQPGEDDIALNAAFVLFLAYHDASIR